MQYYSVVCCALMLLIGVTMSFELQFANQDLVPLALDDSVEISPQLVPMVRQRRVVGNRLFKKAFVRPCMYNVGNCITDTQKERMMQHMKSLFAIAERRDLNI